MPYDAYVLSNTQATFEAQFMKNVSNFEIELKKSVAYKTGLGIQYNRLGA